MEKKVEIGFKLIHIKTEQFALLEDNYTPDMPINFITSLNFKMNSKDKVIGSFVDFAFEQEKKTIIKIQVSCHFKIENNSWKDFLNDGLSTITIPKGFLSHLAMLTVGTTRGVLFAKTEGTEFSKIIIPSINVTAIVKEDAEFLLVPEL